MKKWQRILSGLLCVLLLAALLPAGVLAESEAELNDADLNKRVSVKESEPELALTASTAMLLRRAAIRESAERSVWRGFTESFVMTANGSASVPGSRTYSLSGLNYTVKAYKAEDRSENAFTKLLTEHPEGVVLRFKSDGTGTEQGLLLAKYQDGAFLCLDPDPVSAAGLINITESGYGKGAAGGSKDKILGAVEYYYAVSSAINAHTHTYGTEGETLGVCSGCGYNYYLDHQTPFSGRAVPAEGLSSVSLKLTPYSASDFYRENGELLRYSSLNVLGVTKNQYGNVWYLVESPDKKHSGYVWEDNLTVSSSSAVVITGVTVPENNTVAGTRTETAGTVRASGAQLSSVSAAVYAYDSLSTEELNSILNNTLTAASSEQLAAKRAEMHTIANNIESAEFELSRFSSDIRFDRLSGGRNYLYAVTATDAAGNSATVYRAFYVSGGIESKKSFTVRLSVSGSVSERMVADGSALTLPEASRTGYTFLGWADGESGKADYAPGSSYKPAADVTLFAVFEKNAAPAVPKISCSAKDAAVGETVTLKAEASGAERFTVNVYENGSLLRKRDFTGANTELAFEKAGTYTVTAEAFAGDSGSGESSGVTVTVHGPVLVTFLDGENVWAEQRIAYGASAAEPVFPAHPGSTFAGWDGKLDDIREDTTLRAKFVSGACTVTFLDENGKTLSSQQVAYGASASEPEAHAKAGYAFLGWSSEEWKNVMEDGITVSPVYVMTADEDVTYVAVIGAETVGEGTLVSYTLTNESDRMLTGRVRLSGKNASGEQIASAQGSLFVLASGERFSESVYAAETGAAFWEGAAYTQSGDATLSYPALALSSGDGETELWAASDELKSLGVSYKKIKETKQYSVSSTETYTTAASAFLDWDKKSGSQEQVWGAWSDWQTEPVTADKNREVEKKQVVTVPAHEEYRYGRWYGENVTSSAGGENYAFRVAPSLAYAKSAYKNGDKAFTRQFSAWSTARFNEGGTFSSKYKDNDKTYFSSASGLYNWHIYYTGAASENNTFFWEETRSVAAETETLYRYRVRTASESGNVFTHEKQAGWSFASEKNAKTRTVTNVRFSGVGGGRAVTLTGSLGSAGKNRDAIVTVLMSDGEGHENKYTEQIALDGNGSFRVTVADMSGLTAIGAPCRAYLNVAGSTGSICLASFSSEGGASTVRFADGLTGELMNEQTVSAGETAEPPAIKDHEGYLFLGWSRTPAGITEDTVITAEYEKESFTIVFSDSAAGTETAVTGIPYGTAAAIPAEADVPGYTFLGWSVPEGSSLSSVTSSMRAEAVYAGNTHTVTYLSAPTGYDKSGNAVTETLAVVEVRDGAYVNTPAITGDMHIPAGMRFIGWSEGAAEPVTKDLVLVPLLGCVLDAEEAVPSLPGGMYASGEKLTLRAVDTDTLAVRYRFNTAKAEGQWTEYDIKKQPQISLTESGELEIETVSPDKNTKRFSYTYIVASASALPAAPELKSLKQTDSSSMTLTWSAVKNAKGYILKRVSDCGEECTQLVTGTSFTDKGLLPQRTYTYSLSAYVMNEKNGSAFLLEGASSKELSALFYGAAKPVTKITVKGAASVYTGSSVQLEATVSPSDAAEKSVYWTVDGGTARVNVNSDGLLSAISAGEATVSARANDGSGVYGSLKITVVEPETNAATLNVSTTSARAGSKAKVSVSVTKGSLAKEIRFTVHYNTSKLTLASAQKGALLTGTAPTINTKTKGYVTFTYKGEVLSEAGNLLELTFDVKSSASGSAYVQISNEDEGYELSIIDKNGHPADVAVRNGYVNISGMMLGDVDDSGTVDVEDAYLVRCYVSSDLQLTSEQLLAADVNGDGKVDQTDITLIREYIVKTISVFPAEE